MLGGHLSVALPAVSVLVGFAEVKASASACQEQEDAYSQSEASDDGWIGCPEDNASTDEGDGDKEEAEEVPDEEEGQEQQGHYEGKCRAAVSRYGGPDECEADEGGRWVACHVCHQNTHPPPFPCRDGESGCVTVQADSSDLPSPEPSHCYVAHLVDNRGSVPRLLPGRSVEDEGDHDDSEDSDHP